MKSLLFKILISILSVIIGWGCSQAKGEESVLSMILTGSMHGQLDPCGWKKNPMGGLFRRYVKVQELKSEGKNPVILDAGDFFFSTTNLNKNNIESAIYYPKPCHLQKPYRNFSSTAPTSERLSREVLSLPIAEHINYDNIEFICNSICNFYS